MKKLSYILFFLILLSLFLIFYIFPSMKVVNKIKRDTKDYQLKTEDIKKERSAFIMFDKRETSIILRMKKEVRKRVPVVKNKESLLQLKKDAAGHIMKLAGNMNIPGIKTCPVSGKDIKTDTILTLQGTDNLRVLNFCLSYRSDLKIGLEFINSFSWWGKSIFINKISVTPDNGDLLFIITVKCFYFDNTDHQAEAQRKEEKEGSVDLNSPLLEEKIYNNLPARPVKKKLPETYGRSVFR